jgi:hypothetical protein
MKAKMVFSAMFKFRNLLILAAAMVLAVMLSNPSMRPPDIPGNFALPEIISVPGALAVYAAFVLQTLTNKQFHENFNQRQKFEHIRELNRQANRLSVEARRNTNTTYMNKLRKVMEDKNDIFTSYSNGEHSYLKEKIVEQTLNLVISYLKLLNNFCIRNRELSGVDISAVVNRINNNSRKLNFTNDSNVAEELKKVIDIDERLINRLKEEKKELERIGTKLDYMESTVNLFKHQILSSVESEEMLDQLENAVNEAEALDTVLEDRHKRRIKM